HGHDAPRTAPLVDLWLPLPHHARVRPARPRHLPQANGPPPAHRPPASLANTLRAATLPLALRPPLPRPRPAHRHAPPRPRPHHSRGARRPGPRHHRHPRPHRRVLRPPPLPRAPELPQHPHPRPHCPHAPPDRRGPRLPRRPHRPPRSPRLPPLQDRLLPDRRHR